MSLNKRIEWIDCLRGFAMFFIIYGHVCSLTFGNPDEGNISNLVCSLPLFFCVSGFLAYKPEYVWDKSFLKKMLLKKMRKLLIPATVFYFLLPLALPMYGHWDFPGQYWFTFVLFEMFFVYYIISLLGRFTKPWMWKVSLAVICLLSMVIRYKTGEFVSKVGFYPQFYIFVSEFGKHFYCFVIGLAIRKYWEKVIDYFNSKYTIALFFLLIIGITIIEKYDIHIFSLIYPILVVIKKLGYVLIFFNFFYHSKEFWANKSYVSRSMRYVGSRTLDLYMLHYFFLLPNFTIMGEWLNQSNNIILEFIIVGTWTSVITALCLFVSVMVRTSSFLARYLLGVEPQ